MKFPLLRLFTVLTIFLGCSGDQFNRYSQDDETCTWNDINCYQDPNLKEISIDLGNGDNETFLAYIPPDVSTFYRDKPLTRKAVAPKFNGQFGKFINLSPNPIRIYWSSGSRHSDVYIAETNPFESAATATFPGHVFLVKSKYSDDQILHTWVVTEDQVLYVYDPFESGDLSLSDLNEEEADDYFLQKQNLEFSKQYKAMTGIDYLSLYPLRPRPLHPMWSAEYFGQQHSLVTRETHFIELPPPELLTELIPKATSKLALESFRQPEPFLNLTLTVLSCSPRVLEIPNFLSKVEIDHIMKLATGMTLHQSATKAGTEGEDRKDDDTRTSRNTWVKRGKSPIIDALYRRSADLMQIDEAYLRQRQPEEMSHLATKSSNAEQLQLVHYDVGQQYTPHHDFTVPASIEGQPMRFATILFYLNEGMVGGETTFPRWLNAETKDELRVTPEIGKAILFYSLLPDGNMDERSQHASVPVRRGEKWLTNLWTWDPMMRF